MIFVSHSSKDKKIADDLLIWLLEKGYDMAQVFLDSDADSGIQAGADWKESLHDGLKRCSALLVLYSNNWRDSDWCSYELGHARATGKPIFPVLIEDIPLVGMAGEYQAVRLFHNRTDALDRLWNSLQEQHVGPSDTFLWPHPGLKGDTCPFPGLFAFDERYAAVYFGREPETREVLDMLRRMRNEGEPRILMVVGGSGSGKSSLLKAGVLPRLIATTDWVVLPTLRFGATTEDHTLFDQLARDLVAAYPPDASVKPDWKAIRDRIRSENPVEAAQHFFEATQDLTMALKKKDASALVSIDQFEELLSAAASTSALAFLRFLKAAFARKNCRLLAIGTMRSDYLDVYEKHPHAMNTPLIDPWRLGIFPRERIREVITQPVERADVKIQPELLAQLVMDTPTAEALPLLAFTLEKLYRRYASDGLLELAEYKELGGMEGAIQKSVERIVPENTPKQVLDALRLAFVKHLAQVNDKDEIVRLTANWSSLPAVAQPILEEFVKERLLVKSESARVEVAHEAMFRCWGRLKGWLNEAAEVMRWRRDVRREREMDKTRWRGLRSAQLAVARAWPVTRANELDAQELGWIRQGIRRQWFWRCLWIVLFVVVSGSLASVSIERRRTNEKTLLEDYQRALALANEHHTSGLSDLIDVLERSRIDSFARIERNAQLQLAGFLPFAPWLEAARSTEDPPQLLSATNDATTVAVSFTNGTVLVWDIDSDRSSVFSPHDKQPSVLRLSPYGKYLASGDEDGHVFIKRLDGSLPDKRMTLASEILELTFSNDEESFAVMASDRVLRMCRSSDCKELWKMEPTDLALPHQSSAFVNGRFLKSRESSLRTLDPASGEVLAEKMAINVSAISVPDFGSTIAYATKNGDVTLYDIASNKILASESTGLNGVQRLAIAPNSGRVAIADQQGIVRISRIDPLGMIFDFEIRRANVSDLTFLGGDRWLIVVSDVSVECWDTEAKQPFGFPIRLSATSRPLAPKTPAARRFVVADEEGLRIWHWALPQTIETDGPTVALAFTPRGDRLGSAAKHNASTSRVNVSNIIQRPKPERIWEDKTILSLDWLDDEQLVTALFNGEVTIVQTQSGKNKGVIRHRSGGMLLVSVTRDGRRIISGGNDHYIRSLDVVTKKELFPPLWHEDERVSALSIDDTDRVVFSGTHASEGKLWNLTDGTLIKETTFPGLVDAAEWKPGQMTVLVAYRREDGKSGISSWGPNDDTSEQCAIVEGQVRVITCSATGTHIAIGGSDKVVTVLGPKSETSSLLHSSGLQFLSFNQASEPILTSACEDGTIRIWDARSGQQIGPVLRQGATLLAAAMHPHRDLLATGGRERTIVLWTLPALNLPWLAGARLSRESMNCRLGLDLRDGRPLPITTWRSKN